MKRMIIFASFLLLSACSILNPPYPDSHYKFCQCKQPDSQGAAHRVAVWQHWPYTYRNGSTWRDCYWQPWYWENSDLRYEMPYALYCYQDSSCCKRLYTKMCHSTRNFR